MTEPEFVNQQIISGPFEAFCQPGYACKPRITKSRLVECTFCHSRYNPNNWRRKMRHESGLCGICEAKELK